MTGFFTNNMSELNAYTDHCFINYAKQWGQWQFNPTSGTATEPIFPLVNENGYPQRFPSGVSAGYWEISEAYIYGNVGDQWIYEWTNTGSLTFTVSNQGGSTYTLDTSVPGKITLTITAAPDPIGLQRTRPRITAMTGALTSLKCYRATDAAALAAGQVFTSDFIARHSVFKTLRMLNWNSPIFGLEAQWGRRRTTSDLSYAARKVYSNRWCGSTTYNKGTWSVSQPTDTVASLAHGEIVHFQPAADWTWYAATLSTTNLNPLRVTCTAHPFNTGDLVMGSRTFTSGAYGYSNPWPRVTGGSERLGNSNLSGESWEYFTVTKIDANTFSLDNVNASTWSTGIVSTNVYFTFAPQLKIGSLSAAPIISTLRTQGFSHTTAISTANPYTAIYDANLGVFIMEGGGADPEGSALRYDAGAICGVPIEDLITLCNATSTNPWVQFPALADDNFITQTMTLLKNTLNAGLVPRFEWSNEIWNSAFNTTYYARARASNDGLAEYSYDLFYGKMINRLQDLAFAVWSDRSKYKIIAARQNLSINDTTLTNKWAICTPVSAGNPTNYPINKADILAPAFYFHTTPCEHNITTDDAASTYTGTRHGVVSFVDALWNYKKGGSNRSLAFRWYRDELKYGPPNGANLTNSQSIDGMMTYWLPQWQTLATNYGKTIETYEELPEFYPGTYFITGFPYSYRDETLTQTDISNFHNDFKRSNEYAEAVEYWLASGIKYGITPSIYSMYGAVAGASLTYALQDVGNKVGADPLPAFKKAFFGSQRPPGRRLTAATS